MRHSLTCRRRALHTPLTVRAGRQLQGTVGINIKKKPIEGQVVLLVKGKEKTEVEDRKGSKNSNFENESYTFFETHVELGEHTLLEPGAHSFPFSVNLPDHLPTSTYTILNGIEYTCIAQLNGRTLNKSLFQVIAAPQPCGTSVRNVSGPKTDTIVRRKGSRMPKDVGKVSWAAAVDNNRLGRKGTRSVLSVSCRNHSKVDIAEVSYKLIEQWDCHARYCFETTRKELIPIIRMKLPNYMTSASADSQEEELVGLSVFPVIRSEVESQKCSSRINLYPKLYDCAHDSYQGKLITVTHFIEVELKLPPGYCPLVTKVPIIIGNFEQTQEPAWQGMAQAEAIEVDTPETSFDENNDGASIPFANSVPVTDSLRELPLK